MDSHEPQTSRWSSVGWIGVPVVVGTIGLYFWDQQDLVAVAFLVAMCLASVTGFRVGAIKQVAFVGGLIAAYYFAPTWGAAVQSNVEEHFGITGAHARLLCVAILAHIITLTVTVLVQIGMARTLRQRPRLMAWNRRVGMVVGAMQGVVLMVAIIGGVLTAEPLARHEVDSRRSVDDSTVSHRIIAIAEKTRSSALGRTLADVNPFERLESLQDVHAEVQQLAQSQQLAELLRKATNEDMRGKPRLRRTVDRLRRDPQVRRIFSSGDPVDATSTKELLSNPIVSRVFTDQDLASEVSKLLDEIKAESVVTGTTRRRGR